MTLIKEPFTSQRLEEERATDQRKIFTISLNLEEYRQLQEDMRTLKQSKDGTALKQLWQLGRNVLHDGQTGLLIRTILGNDTRNKRIGINDVETEINAKVTQKTA